MQCIQKWIYFHNHIYLQISHYNFYKLCPEINENILSSALQNSWLCSYLLGLKSLLAEQLTAIFYFKIGCYTDLQLFYDTL